MKRPGTFFGVGLGCVLLCACGRSDGPAPSASAEAFERVGEAAFSGHAGPRSTRAFDVVAADMDLDGDPDLLVNGHHLTRLELFRNDGGRFVLVNPAGDDASGIHDNAGLPGLFADAEQVLSLAGTGPPGLYVWHDTDRRGRWRFHWKPAEGAPAGFWLDLETSLEVQEVEGLAEDEVERVSAGALRLTVERTVPVDFAVKTVQLTEGLWLLARTAAGEPLPLFVGPAATPRPSGELAVWKPDPHGAAWVDVEGDARPELYLTRGGLMGLLVPPRRPKRDRYFRAGPKGGDLYELASPSPVPPDRGRGRRVEWVDLDGDGVPELSVANERTPNKVLARTEGGTGFEDVAPALGLDLEGAEVQAWGDHDGDGLQDLYFLEADGVHLMRNPGDGAFERVSSRGGLDLPTVSPSSGGGDAEGEALFDFAAIRLADFDADGRLDLWLLARGPERTNHLFLRRGAGFADVTAATGLDGVRGSTYTVLFDADNDGFEDVFSGGRFGDEERGDVGPGTGAGYGLLWRNEGGERFVFERLSLEAVPQPIHAAAALDADGDGRLDLALVGVDRFLLANQSEAGHGFLRVRAEAGGRPALGALVRVRTSDGRTLVRRLGSAASSTYSQGLLPLHFGVPAGTRVEELTVVWPGTTEEVAVPVPSGDEVLLERE